MSFYQDEFAGRIATKVMQTALAVRDTWMIVADMLVFVVIYFVTMRAVRRRLRPVAAAAVPRLAGAVPARARLLRAAAGRVGRRRPMRAR